MYSFQFSFQYPSNLCKRNKKISFTNFENSDVKVRNESRNDVIEGYVSVSE